MKLLETLEYTTQQGDTFDLIALDFYNEERLAHLIIAVNQNYCDVLIFDAGIVLDIPIYDETKTAETAPVWRQQ